MVQFKPGLLISSPEGLHHTSRRLDLFTSDYSNRVLCATKKAMLIKRVNSQSVLANRSLHQNLSAQRVPWNSDPKDLSTGSSPFSSPAIFSPSPQLESLFLG